MTRSMPRALLLAATLALMSGTAAAQDFTFGFNPRSGDVWVDTHLGDINRYGRQYREPFIDELVRYRGAPRDLVVDLLGRNWAPGDIYYACTIAQIIGRPCRYVVQEYERDHGQGWGALAKRMGIKPGSPEFHRLKQGFAPTYQRWGRPLRAEINGGPGKSAGAAKKGPGKAHASHGDHGPSHGNGGGKSGKAKGGGDHGPSHGGHGGDKGKGGGKGQGKGKGKD